MSPKETKNEAEKKVRGPRGRYNSTLQSLMDIWNVLSAHASPEKPLTAGEIAAHLQKEHARCTEDPTRTRASGATAEKLFPAEADLINTLFPGTVIREAGKSAILHTYVHDEALHIVMEDADGVPLWSGPMTAILMESPCNPIPYSTLTRMLPQLMEQYDARNALPGEEPPPVSLAGVVAEKGISKVRYIPAAAWEDRAKAGERKQAPTRRFFLQSILSPSQWRILSDLIRVYPYISEQETSHFLSAMKRLAPGIENWSGRRYALKSDCAVNFEHIRLLDAAIQSSCKVTLVYGKYQLVLGEDRRYHPKLLPMTRDNGLMTVDPYAMMWSNGYYYLVCRDGERMRNLRVDRILEVLPTTQPFEKEKDFDPYTYRDRSPVMYPGKPVLTRLKCSLSMLSTLMDFFGTTILDYTPPAADDTTTVTLRASELGTRLFALQYADRVEVLEPESLRCEVAATLRIAAQKYE